MVATPLVPLSWSFVPHIHSLGVVSAPLWNSDTSRFAGMLTVLDIIHLIQYYYRTATYDYAEMDVETFQLESLRGTLSAFPFRTSHSEYFCRD